MNNPNFIQIFTLNIDRIQINVDALKHYVEMKKPWYRRAISYNKEIRNIKMLIDDLESTLQYMRVNGYKFYAYGISTK